VSETRRIQLSVNGRRVEQEVPVRLTLADFLRDRLGLTGTHLGCEQGVCGACTVLLDGEALRSCLLLAVQANDREVTTVEGLSTQDALSPLQEAFHRRHALQCGFCTPGFLVSATALLQETPVPDEAAVRVAMSGNLCRCTGYSGIIKAILDAAPEMNVEGAFLWPSR
jgi:aerobic carbon-monoxide dehydrogenase small subunit